MQLQATKRLHRREALVCCAQVAFNIGGPALNQLANISDKRESDAVRKPRLSLKKRSIVSALVGLSAASLLAIPQAQAATEAFQLAAGAHAASLLAFVALFFC